MVIKQIGYFRYDTEDIVGKCPKCGGDMYSSPDLTSMIDISQETLDKIIDGRIIIGYCPYCFNVDIFEPQV